MAFELKPAQTAARGLRRIVRERVGDALEILNNQDAASVEDDAVHEVRRRMKQVRAALRLARDDLGRKRYDRENETFRAAGRPLAKIRDAQVMIETAQRLAAGHRPHLPTQSLQQLHAALAARRTSIRHRILADGRAVRAIRGQLKKSHRRLTHLPVAHRGWKVIRGGLRRTYVHGREALAAALREGTDEHWHVLRKRGKDLRYELELLRPIRPTPMRAMTRRAHRLTDLLGEDHDLAVLQSILGELKEAVSCRKRLRTIIARRRTRLQREARKVGCALYAQVEDDFVDRIHQFWKEWQSRAARGA